MVTSVMPMRCEISACWLCRGRSRTNDCAGLRPDMAAISRQNRNARRAARNMGMSPSKSRCTNCKFFWNGPDRGRTPGRRFRRISRREVSSASLQGSTQLLPAIAPAIIARDRRLRSLQSGRRLTRLPPSASKSHRRCVFSRNRFSSFLVLSNRRQRNPWSGGVRRELA